MKLAIRLILVLSIAIPSFAEVPRIAGFRPRLTAVPASPVTLGTQVVLTLAGEFPKRVEPGESLLLSFSARRAGEELQVVRPFARETSAKWTPSRAGTYELLATAQLKRRDGSVISETSATLSNYVVNAPSTSTSGSSQTCDPTSPCRGRPDQVGSCVNGSCKFDCRPGLTAVTMAGISTCRNLKSDPMNCGTVGHQCSASSPVCYVGQCVALTACPILPWRCPAGSVAGVEVYSCVDPSTTDPLNCGSCGNRCAYGQNCVNGTCRLAQQP
jgi:hypothetical protein